MELNFIIGIAASLVTIIAGIASAIRYLGRSEFVAEVARRLGVDLYELSGGWETALEREEPRVIMDAYEERIPEDERLRHAGHTLPAGPLIEVAFQYDDVPRERRISEHLSDTELSDLIDERNLWPDPIHQVAQLEDSPGNAYAWILSEEATEEDRESLRTEIERTFIELQHSEPESLHFIVGNIDEIRELDSEAVENYVKPWLREPTSNGNEEDK